MFPIAYAVIRDVAHTTWNSFNWPNYELQDNPLQNVSRNAYMLSRRASQSPKVEGIRVSKIELKEIWLFLVKLRLGIAFCILFNVFQ